MSPVCGKDGMMFTVLAVCLAMSGQLEQDMQQDLVPAAPRNWSNTDPLLHHTPGSRIEPIAPSGKWVGRVEIDVRCTITGDGRLEQCVAVREEPLGRELAPAAVRAFRRATVLLESGGPAPGDTVTYAMVVDQERR